VKRSKTIANKATNKWASKQVFIIVSVLRCKWCHFTVKTVVVVAYLLLVVVLYVDGVQSICKQRKDYSDCRFMVAL
jgi:hypothetical protein